MSDSEPRREQYTIGWVCALPTEAAAAQAMLDETYPNLPSSTSQDSNVYVFGRVRNHKVVIATLPSGSYGTTSAATTAKEMLLAFPEIRFGLLVGIGGGIPSEENDIRLGDVVVSKPQGTIGRLMPKFFSYLSAGMMIDTCRRCYAIRPWQRDQHRFRADWVAQQATQYFTKSNCPH